MRSLHAYTRNARLGAPGVWLVFLLAGLVAPLAIAAPAIAQGWIEPLPGRPVTGVEKVRTSVMVRVTDRVAEVAVEEWFRNPGGGLGEGDYVYPLPGEAVFSNFALFQGDQELRGETMDAERARAIYEEIVRRKKDPALIELVGHGMVRARVFPINPGDTRKITLRYTQVLPRAGDALQFRYVTAGRFAGIVPPGSEQGHGPQRAPDGAPLTFALTVEEGARFRDAFSPTHDLRVTREDGRMIVRPSDGLRGDVTLFLPFAERRVGLTLATHRPAGENGYFMLTLSPPPVAGTTIPRDVTVVVDVSGSMSGEKIEQARAALRKLLRTLAATDRFRLIRFSSGASVYRPEWTVPTRDEIAAAVQWVDELRAEGGTDIAGALAEAFRLPSPADRMPIVVFVTDGMPSVGETNPDRIAQQAEHGAARARVFAFGVGFDVNTYLLDRLSVAGRGSTQYVQPGEDVAAALGALADKIRYPVLADLEIAATPVPLEDIHPGTLPDVFVGEDLVIFGRYRAGSEDVRGRVEVAGTRGGERERAGTSATFPMHATGNDFIPRLWASRKLGALQQQVRLHGPNPELVEAIRATALRYGLLSEYTSYLVQEPVQSTGEVPMPLPHALAPLGRAAVQAAGEAGRARAAKSMADLREVEEATALRMAERDARREASLPVRRIAGRVFLERDGVWTDATYTAGMKTVDIEPYGAAYFALLGRLPELRPYWRVLEHAVVAGRRVAIRLVPTGATRVTDDTLERLVQAFRPK